MTMTTLATRPTDEVVRALDGVSTHPTVEETTIDRRSVEDGWEQIGVVVLAVGIERVPPGVCRAIGEADFGIDTIERFPDGHLEVVVR